MLNISPTARRAYTVAVVLAVTTALWSSAALACRGTDEYPQVSARLEAASMPADEKASLRQRLEEGRALHDKAHETGDKSQMRRSLKILDDVKSRL